MGILEALTLIFVVLKLTGYIAWSWAWVLSPLIVALSLYVILFIGFMVVGIKGNKRIKRFKQSKLMYKPVIRNGSRFFVIC